MVGECADLVGKSIGEALRARDISVLTLHEGSTVIPNPRDGRLLAADDRLLCFGELEQMRSLVSERRRERGRPTVRPLPEALLPGPEPTRSTVQLPTGEPEVVRASAMAS